MKPGVNACRVNSTRDTGHTSNSDTFDDQTKRLELSSKEGTGEGRPCSMAFSSCLKEGRPCSMAFNFYLFILRKTTNYNRHEPSKTTARILERDIKESKDIQGGVGKTRSTSQPCRRWANWDLTTWGRYKVDSENVMVVLKVFEDCYMEKVTRVLPLKG